MNNVAVVYTSFTNLKKTASMDVGQVGFHDQRKVSTVSLGPRDLFLWRESWVCFSICSILCVPVIHCRGVGTLSLFILD